MSLFHFAKYSTIVFFLGKYRSRIFSIVAVLLFAVVTSLLYQDVVDYLHKVHPGIVIYALIAKIVIVYGALAFVLWQFRPARDATPHTDWSTGTETEKQNSEKSAEPNDRLSKLEDLKSHDHLLTRYERMLQGEDASDHQ